MELQQAEGKIMLGFIRSKCFVKFFVCVPFFPNTPFTPPYVPGYCFSQTAAGWTSAAFCPNHTMALQITSESTGCE